MVTCGGREADSGKADSGKGWQSLGVPKQRELEYVAKLGKAQRAAEETLEMSVCNFFAILFMVNVSTLAAGIIESVPHELACTGHQSLALNASKKPGDEDEPPSKPAAAADDDTDHHTATESSMWLMTLPEFLRL